MKKEFCTYEQALALKELGFDEPCLKMAMSDIDTINAERTDEGDYPRNSDLYSGWVAIPSYSQAFKFFRDKYELTGLVEIGTREFSYQIYDKKGDTKLGNEPLRFNGKYEEAENECLDKLIEVVKNQ